MSILGEFLTQKRKEMKLTQMQVAQAFGWTSPQFVSNIERGTAKLPMDKVKKAIEIYSVPADEFIEIFVQQTRESLKALVA